MEQQTSEWFEARLGKVTASRIIDVTGKLKSGAYTQKRQDYLEQLVAERLSGQPTRHFVTAAMQHGIEHEAEARAFYESKTGHLVEEVGFIDHPTIALAGASPDGLINADGMVEIKCPSTTTHIDFFLQREIPHQYALQMTWQMVCAQRTWCDLVSYDPRLPDLYKMVVVRFAFDPALARQLEHDVSVFLQEIHQYVQRLALAAKEAA